MKFTVRLSSVSVVAFVGLVLALLVLADLHAHRGSYTPGVSSSAERIVTKEFVLVDDEGRTRARIGMNDSDSPSLQLFDHSGQQRAQIRLNKDDVPSLRLYDDNGRLRSVTGFCLNDQTPQFIQFDENGSGHALQNPTYNMNAAFTLFRDEDTRGSFPLNCPGDLMRDYEDNPPNGSITTLDMQSR